MICPHCAAKGTTSVLETRLVDDCLLKRKRACEGCRRTFATYEVPANLARMDRLGEYAAGLRKRRKTAELERAIAAKPHLTSGQLSMLLKVPAVTIRSARKRLRLRTT